MNDQLITYHANGKLLLCGEYFVLHGAKALALPLKVGQQLKVDYEFQSQTILWKAIYNGHIWFWCQLSPKDFSVINTNDQEKAATLSKIFHSIRILNPDFYPKAGTRFETTLNANPEWGIGSSSTLISLLSQYSGVDPYQLNRSIFNGSGFDIACAQSDGPIFYTQDQPVQRIKLDYPFADQLMLIYSGKKKKTHPEVDSFMKEKKISTHLINEISDLSDEFSNCIDQNVFNNLIREHEKVIGELIGRTPVKEHLFADFHGEIKSLGAWGGDFYLVSSTLSNAQIKIYFENKGLTTTFRWPELILIPEIQ